MGYFLSFGLLYLGYCLVDWGHYIVKHEPVSLWWLMSGLGSKYSNPDFIPYIPATPAVGPLAKGSGNYLQGAAQRAAAGAKGFEKK